MWLSLGVDDVDSTGNRCPSASTADDTHEAVVIAVYLHLMRYTRSRGKRDSLFRHAPICRNPQKVDFLNRTYLIERELSNE